MRIGILHYTAPPIVGGVESVLGHHARLMAEGGHQVRILAGRGKQTDSRVDFIHLPLADSRHPKILSIKAELDRGNVPASFSGLVDEIANSLNNAMQGVETLIAHNVCSLHKNLPLTAALRRLWDQGCFPNLILWHHDLAWTTPRYRAELYSGFPWDLLCSDWPGAKQVVVSELRQRELADLTGTQRERISIVPNGIEALQFLGFGAQTREIVDLYNLLAAEPLLLLPVRITPRKNIELALRSLAAMSESLPHSVLVVTGPLGPHNPDNLNYFARLKSMRDELALGQRACFLAEFSSQYLPDEVVAELYRLADALLLPSREEGFGIPILEAGISGIPIFCADIPPLRSLAGEGAIYFSPDSEPEHVAGLICGYLSNNPVYKMRLQVRRKYSWKQIYTHTIAPLLE